ncbi:MAG: hypothetical protein H6741_19315 [Alphaproteobacteria bacterium]|nr:hypothetical protein [Alphaproteobacteria bacterium]
MLVFVMLVSCFGAPDASNQLPRGSWTLEGEGFSGTLSSEEGCSIGLWGPGWATGGADPVPCVVASEGGQTWLYFSFQGGAGEGQAAARLEDDALILPLGARPGEWEVRLARELGGLEPSLREGLARRASESILLEQAGWVRGMLTLWDGEHVVGEISLPANALPEIAVFDGFWMTDGVEVPDLASHGPDLVLSFPVSPSFGGGLGQLRVNRVRREAVVPVGAEPTPDDRRLKVQFGELDAEQRVLARERAVAQANAKERSLGAQVGRELALTATAAAKGGGCPPVEALGPRWGLALQGYAIRIERGEAGCEVVLEPKPVQHRRRWSARVGVEGVMEERMSR